MIGETVLAQPGELPAVAIMVVAQGLSSRDPKMLAPDRFKFLATAAGLANSQSSPARLNNTSNFARIPPLDPIPL
jgi:hypothetical protein